MTFASNFIIGAALASMLSGKSDTAVFFLCAALAVSNLAIYDALKESK